jgi:hypothetical protein
MQTVIVKVDEDAKVTVEAQGVVGQGCEALTAAIEQALGTRSGDVKKPEFHQGQKQGQAQAGQR